MPLTEEQKQGFRLNSLEDTSEYFQHALPTIRSWISKGMPREETDEQVCGNKRYIYDVRQITIWLRKEGPWRRLPTNVPRGNAEPSEDDLLLTTEADSPAIERWRSHKADLAEMDVEERRGQLASVDFIREKSVPVASLAKSCGEELGSKFGAEAQTTFNDFIASCKGMIKNALEELRNGCKDPGTVGRSDNDSAGSPD